MPQDRKCLRLKREDGVRSVIEEDMEIADVKQHIKNGEFDKFYIFYGTEHAVMKIYLKMMAEKGDLELTYVDSLMDLMTGVRTKALIPVRHLYVIMDDKEYLTTESMWEKFTGLKDDVVVFYYTNADKRLKFWKNNKDRAVEFGRLEDRILIKYIKQTAPMLSDAQCNILIDACDGDYGRILLELDKVRMYSTSEKITGTGAFDSLIEQRAIYYQPKDAIFDFVAAVLERRPAKAYDLLQQSKAVGEANLVLLSVLYNNFKTLLQVQSSKNWKALGLNGFAVKNVINYKNNYSNAELVKAIKLIREIEKGIKIGSIPDELSLEYFLVQVI